MGGFILYKSKVKICCAVSYKSMILQIALKIMLYGFITLYDKNLKINSMVIKQFYQKKKSTARALFKDNYYNFSINCIKKCGRKLICNDIKIEIMIAMEQSAYTAVGYGLCCACKKLIIIILKKFLKCVSRPEIKIENDFVSTNFAIKIHGIFTITLGNIIYIVFHLIMNYWRMKNGRISNSRINENSNAKYSRNG